MAGPADERSCYTIASQTSSHTPGFVLRACPSLPPVRIMNQQLYLLRFWNNMNYHRSVFLDEANVWMALWWRLMNFTLQKETFSVLLAFVRGIHRPSVNSPHKEQWRGALMFSLICAWTNGWINNQDAGDLRRRRANYDVTVMKVLGYIRTIQDSQLSPM